MSGVTQLGAYRARLQEITGEVVSRSLHGFNGQGGYLLGVFIPEKGETVAILVPQEKAIAEQQHLFKPLREDITLTFRYDPASDQRDKAGNVVHTASYVTANPKAGVNLGGAFAGQAATLAEDGGTMADAMKTLTRSSVLTGSLNGVHAEGIVEKQLVYFAEFDLDNGAGRISIVLSELDIDAHKIETTSRLQLNGVVRIRGNEDVYLYQPCAIKKLPGAAAPQVTADRADVAV